MLAARLRAAASHTASGGPGGTGSDPITWSSGAYLDHSAAAVTPFGTFRDRPVQTIAVFPTHATQADIADPWYLGASFIPAGYTGDVAIAVPMCADGQTVATDISAQITSLANALAAHSGPARYFLRLGWEMNLPGWPWKVTDANLATWRSRWVTYYDIFKGALSSRGLVGFNPNIGSDQSGLTGGILQAWVDGKVDWCGPDDYDCYPPATTSGNIATRRTGTQRLDFWASTARTKGVGLALPEWGVSSGTQWAGNTGNDNPGYIDAELAWMTDNKDVMLFDAYFNEPADYVASDIWVPSGTSTNPLTATRYAALFAAP